MLKRFNLQSKITIVTYLMILLVVSAGAIAIDRVIVPSMEADLIAESWRIARGVVSQLDRLSEEPSQALFEARMTPIFEVRPKLLYVEAADPSRTRVFWMGDQNYRVLPETKPAHENALGALFVMERTPPGLLYEIITASPSSPQPAWRVRVGINATAFRDLTRQLFRLLFTVTLILLLVSFFLIRWFTGMITRPVNQLLRLTKLLARGDTEACADAALKCPPCWSGTVAQDGSRLDDEPPFCPACPLFSIDEATALPAPPGQLPGGCSQCQRHREMGRDELCQLLLAFQCMAAGIRIYQRKLRQRYEFEERLLEACPDGIMANDRTGRIILYNKGAERLLGYEAREVLEGLSVAAIYPPGEPHRIKEALLSSAYGGEGILLDYTTEVIRKDGRAVPIRLSATMVHHRLEEYAVVGYFHDLTELTQHTKALEELNDRLDASNKELARLNRHYLEMLAFVTHELKSPVANALMSANALRQEIFGPLSPEQLPMVTSIRRNLTQSMEMIRHYLDLSRIEKDELPTQPRLTGILAEVVEPVVHAFAGAIGEQDVKVVLDVAPDLQWELDPELFRGVFTNLLGNALNYGEAHGTIRISARRTPKGLHMEVWNSGPGIPAEDRDRLFRKFQRLPSSKPSMTRGTGLGLYITKAVVERHGGSIRAESEPGKWAAFVIELPS